jgi:DNA-binding LacI/PurR family transcriptional regulator
VLNGKADRVHIAQATQAHVKEIAKKLNYHPAVFNPGRLNGRTGIIGLLAENYTNLNNASWLHFLSQKAHNQGYVIVPKIATNNNAVDIAEHFPADGFILLDKNIKTSPLEKINKIVNVVCAGFQIGNFPFVAPDYSLQINELIAALYRRNKRAIGYLDIKENTAEQTTKLNAYKENYCQRFGIPENIVLPKNSNSKALTEACFQLVKNGANGIILGSNEVAEMA